jgi:hypothetical protein
MKNMVINTLDGRRRSFTGGGGTGYETARSLHILGAKVVIPGINPQF